MASPVSLKFPARLTGDDKHLIRINSSHCFTRHIGTARRPLSHPISAQRNTRLAICGLVEHHHKARHYSRTFYLTDLRQVKALEAMQPR